MTVWKSNTSRQDFAQVVANSKNEVFSYFGHLAVAEMGDHLATTDTGRKLGEGLCSFWGQLGPHLTQCRPAEAYLRTKWHLDQSSRLATTDMGRKLGGGCAPFGGSGSWVPM